MKTQSYYLDDKHIAVIKAVAKDHGDTTASAALRYTIDRYIELEHSEGALKIALRRLITATERVADDTSIPDFKLLGELYRQAGYARAALDEHTRTAQPHRPARAEAQERERGAAPRGQETQEEGNE